MGVSPRVVAKGRSGRTRNSISTKSLRLRESPRRYWAGGSRVGTRTMRLTDKQRAVFDLLLQQYQSKEIARRLGVSPAAIEERIRVARVRYGGVSRAEAIRLCAHEIAGGDESALRLFATGICELGRPRAAGDPDRFSLQWHSRRDRSHRDDAGRPTDIPSPRRYLPRAGSGRGGQRASGAGRWIATDRRN